MYQQSAVSRDAYVRQTNRIQGGFVEWRNADLETFVILVGTGLMYMEALSSSPSLPQGRWWGGGEDYRPGYGKI